MEAGSVSPHYRWLKLVALYGMWIGFFLYILRYAWVSEDAYITFRVIENFFTGYGLRWNVNERVQAYTHPLWLLLHLPLQPIWQNVFFSSIVLSVMCSAAAMLVVMRTVEKPVWMVAAFLFAPLMLSKSFMDYTSSGLENPLSYLLYACFFYVALRLQEYRYFWFFCSLSTALALFNRIDVIWLYAPLLLYLVCTRKVNWRQVAMGALPFAGWLLFSLWYYGFIFPNTKYAKLDTGMDEWLYIEQGIEYYRHLLIIDSVGAAILFSIFVFFLPARFFKLAAGSHLPILFASGIVLQCIYIILVGGDYMAGRFLALPIFATALLWFYCLPNKLRPDVLFAMACLFATAYVSSQMLVKLHFTCKECVPLRGRVMNASHVFSANRLVMRTNPMQLRSEGHYPFAKEGEKLRKENADVKKLFFVGMPAYYAGPAVNVIDELGLADPLLARLPAADKQYFYISHFRRDIPAGYMNALRTGSLEDMQPDLARYYQKLRLIISGNVWDAKRLKTILLFNLGYYDYWKEQYLAATKKAAEVKPVGKK